MAVFPCDWGNHRYPGPQRSMYVTEANGISAQTHKLRLCQEHFRIQERFVKEHFAELDGASQMSFTCEQCPNERSSTLFVKMYDDRAEVREYAVDLCPVHGRAFGNDLHVASGTPMGDA